MHLTPKGFVANRFKILEYERVCSDTRVLNRFAPGFAEHLNFLGSEVKSRFSGRRNLQFLRQLLVIHLLFSATLPDIPLTYRFRSLNLAFDCVSDRNDLNLNLWIMIRCFARMGIHISNQWIFKFERTCADRIKRTTFIKTSDFVR